MVFILYGVLLMVFCFIHERILLMMSILYEILLMMSISYAGYASDILIYVIML